MHIQLDGICYYNIRAIFKIKVQAYYKYFNYQPKPLAAGSVKNYQVDIQQTIY